MRQPGDTRPDKSPDNSADNSDVSGNTRGNTPGGGRNKGTDMARTGIAAPGAGRDTGRDPDKGPDTADDAALAALLGRPEPVIAGQGKGTGSGTGQSRDEGPGLSDLAAGLTRGELEDVLSAMFDTGEERDPDSFDDSLFLAPLQDAAALPVQATPPQTSGQTLGQITGQTTGPDASSRVVRFADVWRGRQRDRAAADAGAAGDRNRDHDPESLDAGLLDAVLANSNDAAADTPTDLGRGRTADRTGRRADADAETNGPQGGQPPAQPAAPPATAPGTYPTTHPGTPLRDDALAALLDSYPAGAAPAPRPRDPLDDLLDSAQPSSGSPSLAVPSAAMTATPTPVVTTLDDLLRDPLEDVLSDVGGGAADRRRGTATPEEAALAFALAFAEPADRPADPLADLLGDLQDDGQEAALDATDAAPVAKARADAAGMADLLGADLLDAVLRGDDPAVTPPVPTPSPTIRTAEVVADDTADDGADDGAGDGAGDADWAGDWDLAFAADDDLLDDALPVEPDPKTRPDAARTAVVHVNRQAAATSAAPPETPAETAAEAPSDTAVTGMQDAVGADLLADLLRDTDDNARMPPDMVPEMAPDMPRGPATPFIQPGIQPGTQPATQPRREPRIRSGMDELDRVLQVGASRPAPTRKWVVRLIWLIILGGLIYVAFLPYRFEVGGEFVVQPVDRAEVRARTGGEITSLHVAEGDWVEAGAVMAVLSNWNQTRDIALIEAEGARLQAQLATLKAGARPEEIAVAEQALASAEVQLAMRAQDLERQESLFASGTIALKAVEDARSAHQLAQSTRDQTAAALTLVQAGPRDTEIAGLEAAIAGNAEELAFAELMLEYTNIRATVSGQIVSSMNDVPVGYSLATGGLFAEIEDNRTVIAELAVPEITIREVALGAPVELRLWSVSQEAIAGTVRSIAPRAEEQDFGQVVRVQVEVPNPDGRLAANLTGFGKIAAAERPVWEAFSRAIQRFFVIELWSWLP